nr:TonB family protein [Janthinobacterium sp. JC611]
MPAQASSSATPAPSSVRGPQAAPFDSDTASNSAAPASWQSRVLGHLAHFKRYPGDARQRKRAGAAWVRFQVDRDGKLLASELITSSGTVLLDREAMQVLQRAQPLPAPPANVLQQGTVTVTLPVSFKLDAS